MTHIFFITRGINHEVELWKTHAQAQYYKWKRKDEQTGKEIPFKVQGALRPIQLWEYVLPDECVNEALTAFQISMKGAHWGHGKAKYGLPVLRSALGCKKLEYKRNKKDETEMDEFLKANNVPEDKWAEIKEKNFKHWEELGYREVVTDKYIHRAGVALEVIGIKKDAVGSAIEKSYTQEML